MILSEKYKDINVSDLILEQSMRLIDGINDNTRLVIVFGESGSGRTVLANYIKSRFNDFEIIENFDWLNKNEQLEKIKYLDRRLIIISKRIRDLDDKVIEASDIMICTSNKHMKIVYDRLKLVACGEGIKVDDLDLIRIADRYGQDIRGAINSMSKYNKKNRNIRK